MSADNLSLKCELCSESYNINDRGSTKRFCGYRCKRRSYSWQHLTHEQKQEKMSFLNKEMVCRGCKIIFFPISLKRRYYCSFKCLENNK